MTTPNSQGATAENIPQGQQTQGNPLPKDLPRTKEEAEALSRTDDEEHGTPVAKTPDEKAKEAAAIKAAEEAKAKEEAEKAEAEQKNDDGTWKEAYVELEGSGQAVVELLKEKNVSPVEANAIFADAIKSGDLKDVKWDVLESRLGKAAATLARKGIEDYYEGVYKENVATRKAVHEVAGSEDNWGKVTTWAKKQETSDPAFKKELDEIRKGIDLGGRFAKQAAKDLVELYHKDTKNTGLGNTKLVTGERTNDTATVKPITRRQYIDGLHKLQAEGGTKDQYTALQNARRAGMKQGI